MTSSRRKALDQVVHQVEWHCEVCGLPGRPAGGDPHTCRRCAPELFHPGLLDEAQAALAHQPTLSELMRRVRLRRAELGLTQDDVAWASGLTQARISQYESGAVLPKTAALLRILSVLGLRLEVRTQDAPPTFLDVEGNSGGGFSGDDGKADAERVNVEGEQGEANASPAPTKRRRRARGAKT